MVLHILPSSNDMQIRWAMKFLARVNVETRCSDIFLFDLFFGWKLWRSRCECVWVCLGCECALVCVCVIWYVCFSEFYKHCMHARVTRIVCCLESLPGLKNAKLCEECENWWCVRAKFSAIIQLNGSAWQSASALKYLHVVRQIYSSSLSLAKQSMLRVYPQ